MLLSVLPGDLVHLEHMCLGPNTPLLLYKARWALHKHFSSALQGTGGSA